MIVFGNAQSILKEGTLNNVNCPNCKQTTQFIYTVSMEYLHFYGIPTAPSQKVTEARCTNCGRVFDFKYLPTTYQKKIEFESFGIKTPLKYYTGFIIAAALIIVFIFFYIKNIQDNDTYITAPIRGDIYSYETEEGKGHYSTLKIADVTADTLYVYLNDYETNKKTGISEIDVFKNYTLDTFVISRTEIDSMYQNGKIFEIEREE